MRIGFTKTGIVFIGLMFLIYIGSMQTDSGLLFMLLGILFSCYVINAFGAWRSARSFQLTPPASVTGTEGIPVRGSWTLGNDSKQTIGNLEVKSTQGSLFRVAALAPKETVHITPKLQIDDRGVHKYADLQLSSTFPFGLIRCRRPLSATGEIVIFPAVYACEAPQAAGFEPMLGGRFTGKYRTNSGDQFHSIRPAQPEDPLKLIHWPSSSKGLGIMVREFDEELSGHISVIVDVPSAADKPLVDAIARVTGSIALAGLDQGHQMQLAQFGDDHVQTISPFMDVDVVLDRMARLEALNIDDPQASWDALAPQLPHRSGLCFVMTELDDARLALCTELHMQGRKVTVLLPDGLQDQVAGLQGKTRFFQSHQLT
jgi:uncharacterized protein (DUF58 family)